MFDTDDRLLGLVYLVENQFDFANSKIIGNGNLQRDFVGGVGPNIHAGAENLHIRRFIGQYSEVIGLFIAAFAPFLVGQFDPVISVFPGGERRRPLVLFIPLQFNTRLIGEAQSRRVDLT